MGQTHTRGPWLVACTRGQRPPPFPCNHTNTRHYRHCNDSPGRNTNQLRSTVTAQPTQMPVTHIQKKDTTFPPHTLQPLHATLQAVALLTQDNQRSSTPPSPPNHPAHQSMREKRVSRVTRPD
ncbi:hypothetical protein ILYODFUR_028954 [Ilyodon furcidens]|uniref:Uncharacterized protein n=1 Tax=Ilyodon furcidens TaxID=33524 RepID=A0ABV0U9D9_9TELE